MVATPIGNLADFSFRAVEILQSVDFIAAEDTRHSRPLLDRYDIAKPLIALHEHNEDAASGRLVDRLQAGESAALISDAGTPLINDPGYPLVRLARSRGVSVVPVPGPCALIAALSASGLPSDRFAFEGFPPRTASARRKLLENLSGDTRTLVFYESSHRVLDFVSDIAAVLPAERPVVIARELTKLHESFLNTTAGEAVALMQADSNSQRGEFVVVIQGAPAVPAEDALGEEPLRILKLLLEECSLKTAVSLCARITGARKELIYRTALAFKEGGAD
ncbi:16S rRNA (cytidine(1402)-2'-O)-methyltransferase [Methylococcus sp. EFPC2]|nr:16S rRNA (cytidine(1402)-2'-O)-methyltransferase [Methylococcus sp. EFPC2]